MLEGLDVETIILLAVAWLGGALVSTVIVWKWIVPHFFGPYVRGTIIEMLSEPDAETQNAVNGLVGMLFACKIKTGKRIADEEGKEYDEELPLWKFIGRELSNSMLYKLKASRGGAKAAAGEALTDELGPMLGLGPRKGQSTFDYAVEQLIPRAMPMLEKKMAEMMEKKSF